MTRTLHTRSFPACTIRTVLISINTRGLNCESGGSRAAAPLSAPVKPPPRLLA